ncbi:hypothetical protein [Streptomyces justiciae]|uniref:hypothetical protein n=1 Tax=Streptomyces justiciae TaxID=2780140 RepID=UPI002240300B|nr:hypothetical protein [Streptomyces justiciae]
MPIHLSGLGKDLAVIRRDDRRKGWEWHSDTSFLDNPGEPPLLAGGYVFPRRGGASVEDAIAVGLRTRRTAWTLKTVDAEADDVQLLTDGRTLYVLRGTRLRVHPLT